MANRKWQSASRKMAEPGQIHRSYAGVPWQLRSWQCQQATRHAAGTRVAECAKQTQFANPAGPEQRGHHAKQTQFVRRGGCDCDCGLRIGDSTQRMPGMPNKASFPVPPAGAKGQEVSNEPNLLRFWPENEGGEQNKANLRPREARDWGLEIADSRRPMRGMSNEPNLAERAVGGHGRPCGMVGKTPADRREALSPGVGSRECQTNPICGVFGLKMGIAVETKPTGRPGRARLEIGDSRQRMRGMFRRRTSNEANSRGLPPGAVRQVMSNEANFEKGQWEISALSEQS